MNTQNTASKIPALFLPDNRDLVTKLGDPAKNGAQGISARRMSRNEFAEARKLDKKAPAFDQAYKDYLKTQESHGTLLVETARQSGLIFAATSARKDKDGNLISLSVRFGKQPTEKVDAKAIKIAELEAKLEALTKLLPAPAPKTEPQQARK